MPVASSRLARNLEAVRSRIDRACTRARREPSEVTLVAVTKGVGADETLELARLDVRDLGENRADALEGKRAALARSGLELRWHMIGHLQTNKVRRVLPHVDVLHSLDRDSLAETLSREVERSGRAPLSAFVQVNVSGERSKGGVAPRELPALLDLCRASPRLAVCGLMTMAPLADDAEASRPCFRRLRELRDEVRSLGYREVLGLSMGMSQDFEIAIEEGATHVRVGSLLFTD
jgi:PLP dependent protein